MANITFKGNPVTTVGDLPAVGSTAPAFRLLAIDLSEVGLDAFPGTKVLNVFPSVDTRVCAASVRQFSKEAVSRPGVKVLNVSLDLPFAHKRFNEAEGLDGVVSLSAFRSTFGKDYGLEMADGPLAGLLSRAVLVIDEKGTVVYTEQVPEIAQEPSYEAALAALP